MKIDDFNKMISFKSITHILIHIFVLKSLNISYPNIDYYLLIISYIKYKLYTLGHR